MKRQEEERRRALESAYSAKEYEVQNTRKWKPGDVYAPHDLSGIEMAKWKKIRRKGKTNWDVMDQLGMDPREHYKVRPSSCKRRTDEEVSNVGLTCRTLASCPST